jgi:hypothetical protein
MTSPARSEITALVKQAPAGVLPPEAARLIAERKAVNAVSRAIMGMSWGQQLDANTAQAIAEYARRYGMDPARHLDLLGGKLYPNAQYYIEQGAALMQAGLVASVRQQHIEADARLTARYERLREWEQEAIDAGRKEDAYQYAQDARDARQEILERESLRIRFNVPEKAAAAVVTWITLVGQQEPIAGCNWAGGGVKQRDPVGEAEPSKTAESRSARRAWRQLVRVCPELTERIATVDEDGKAVSAVIAESRQRFEQVESDAPRLTSSAEVGALMPGHEAGYSYNLPTEEELSASSPAPRAETPAILPDSEDATRPGTTSELALGDTRRRPRSRIED